jgi:hypothetical protein
MKKVVRVCAIGTLSLFSSFALAEKQSAVLQLADETAKIALSSETQWVQETYRVEAGFQFDNDSNYALDANVLYQNKGMLDPNIDIGFKAKLAYVAMDQSGDSTLGALLGIQASYWLPTPVPTALVGEYLYGPKILTTGDGEALTEAHIKFKAQLMTNLSGYVGYRRFTVNMENGASYDFDKGIHLGIELSF